MTQPEKPNQAQKPNQAREAFQEPKASPAQEPCQDLHLSSLSQAQAPRWFWMVGSIAMLWNLLGCAAFAMQTFGGEAALAALPEAQQEWFRSLPLWLTIVFGIAVTSGVIGCIGFLMQRRWALPVFGVSLVAVLIQMTYSMIIANGIAIVGNSDKIMSGLIIIGAVAMVVLTASARNKGWLR